MKHLEDYNVLFLEDNDTFAKSTIKFLEIFFQDIYHSKSIKDALSLYRKNSVHLIICDIKVEDGNGLDFISQIRKNDKNIPIVVVSAHKDEDFLFKAIELNLSTYKIKPLNYDDFMEIFDLVVERMKYIHQDIADLGERVCYSFQKKMLFQNDIHIPLSKKETLLIELFAKNKNKVVTKQQIDEYVWDYQHMSDSALKNLILRLRKKLGNDFIQTLPNIGFRLQE